MSATAVAPSHLIDRRSQAVAIRLSDLPVGSTARFNEARLAPQDCAVLGAIGLTERSSLRVCKGGEPLIVQVRATRIGLSRSVAEGIMVIPEIGG